ncbi:hypothetical protein GMORB2_3610 [Geosmithia morbida]|uniref:Zn(2)-C6 fungal-type domain-containing protein n=1 Tax=Geosmithia morbida TaxID=1094350 RepID=A0A9P4YNY7_9HYPO|nr:uncharacterized protein GMORB2_3610 [Geosmithia morbida]KAF4119922.1 hypothetical protein GMORB2_3610 [Geosmithia morbida]
MYMPRSTSAVPQGFSIYQPSNGAPLRFLPALGTKELDDLLDAYVSGSASLKEKRAEVSVDFFAHMQATGQSFKFYVVPGMYATSSMPEPPSTTAASVHASTSTSSVNVSPVTSNWDWSFVSSPQTPAEAASSSHPSKRHQTTRHHKAISASSQHPSPPDFSHIPGMKILTKDGTDVTNSASRGCKTKEQRDHAHLMRIIKACDSCRKKKIRCDPSHKRQMVAVENMLQETLDMALDLDTSFAFDSFPGIELCCMSVLPLAESREDFIQYSPSTSTESGIDFSHYHHGFELMWGGQQVSPSSTSEASPFAFSNVQEASSFYSSSSPDTADLALFQSTELLAATAEESAADGIATQPAVYPPTTSGGNHNRHNASGQDENRRSGMNIATSAMAAVPGPVPFKSGLGSHASSPSPTPATHPRDAPDPLELRNSAANISEEPQCRGGSAPGPASGLVNSQRVMEASSHLPNTRARLNTQARSRATNSSLAEATAGSYSSNVNNHLPGDKPYKGLASAGPSAVPAQAPLSSNSSHCDGTMTAVEIQPAKNRTLIIPGTSDSSISTAQAVYAAQASSTAAATGIATLATVGPSSTEGSNLGHYATQAQRDLESIALTTYVALVAVLVSNAGLHELLGSQKQTAQKGTMVSNRGAMKMKGSRIPMPPGAAMTPQVSVC